MTIDSVKTSKLDEALEEHAEDKLELIEPGGNHGDTLIYMGAKKRLDSFNIEYSSMNYIQELRNSWPAKGRRAIDIITNKLDQNPIKITSLDDPDVIYIHGGGNFSDLWGISLDLFRNIVNTYPNTHLIVGPQTYWFSDTDFDDICDNLDQKIDLFCRESYSYSLLNNFDLPNNINIYKSSDTAFYLTRDDLLEYHKKTVEEFDSEYTLLAFRGDREGIIPESMKEHIASNSDNVVFCDVSDKSENTFREFITLVENAEKVYTDRLHVGILSTLLEQDVELFENIYYKNRGVYKYSLSDIETTNFNEAV
ncbi:polysaccharide pyruvyl transferase family protein [Haloarcula sp. CGMCC 1.6347]|uniref:polysaccharide pyruvyl transferase family protein n=1 Tax=Haloarcula sp. CGMCC 1.6347 TaxID=3111455 RepID=UPI00300ED864